MWVYGGRGGGRGGRGGGGSPRTLMKPLLSPFLGLIWGLSTSPPSPPAPMMGGSDSLWIWGDAEVLIVARCVSIYCAMPGHPPSLTMHRPDLGRVRMD